MRPRRTAPHEGPILKTSLAGTMQFVCTVGLLTTTGDSCVRQTPSLTSSIDVTNLPKESERSVLKR